MTFVLMRLPMYVLMQSVHTSWPAQPGRPDILLTEDKRIETYFCVISKIGQFLILSVKAGGMCICNCFRAVNN